MESAQTRAAIWLVLGAYGLVAIGIGSLVLGGGAETMLDLGGAATMVVGGLLFGSVLGTNDLIRTRSSRDNGLLILIVLMGWIGFAVCGFGLWMFLTQPA
jgi:hypothetical protein